MIGSASDWEAHDDLIDSYFAKTVREIKFVFMQALGRIPDDPSEVVFDIILLDLLESGLDDLIRSLPLRERAFSIARTLPEDAPDGTTRGLEDAAQGVKNTLYSAVRTLALAIVTLATQMTLFRRTGFKQAVSDLLDPESLAQEFNQALILWDRIVLDRIGDLKEDPLWVYDGPADKRNRPFCAEIVRLPRAYTREQIEKLNSHPLLADYVPPNVFMLCGGYNCRHVFLPVSRAFADQNGLEVQ